MSSIAEDILMHYGMPRRSGRYPWGSGDDPYQHGSHDFLSRVEELKKTGWTETPENIMKEFGLTTTQYRVEKSLAKDSRRMLNVAKAKSMAEDGKTPTEIGKEMGVNESTVRSWLNSQSEARMKQAQETANFIRDQIETKGMIDIGTGVEQELRISKEKLKEAITILENEGYPVYKGGIPQVTNQGQQTNQKVICPKGTPHSEIYKFDKIHALNEDQYISRDGGSTFEKKFHYPESMDSKRLTIRYKEDGGIDMDGVVELRRNVPDLSLGENRYSQVRILVDGTHYIKGMAVYADDLPPGVDVRFNTNKTKGTPMTKVLKEIKNDPDNPFGSAIKDADQGGQYWYTDKDGKKKLGLINKRAAEGDWEDWADALPSQFLGKQNKTLIEKQLKLAKADRVAEFDEICSLTNPTIKKHLLNKFADECDSAAVHLKAAALPGQKYHVILPVNTLKETEVYAPRYKDGEKLALVRYPHGGTFEIPILTVNNKNARAIQLMGKEALDAVGINSKVAERLSGADFDGDTVMCIPTHDRKGRVKITSTPVLKDLEGFDPKTEYGPETYKGRDVKLMKNTNTQMGVISNLITDMTLAGATDKEMARAVKHSMVVIDAEKHKLDYKRSEIENGIPALHKKYQGKTTGGAATLLSRAKGEYPVPKRQGTPKLNIKGTKDYDPTRPEGALLYKTADDVEYTVTKTNKRTGAVTTTVKKRTQKSTKMAEYDDAYELVSTFKHKKELVYADYANDMKDLARKARIEAYNTGKVAYSKTAKSTYQQEVNDLDSKLRTAELNKPKERAAQRKANAEVTAKKTAYEKETGQKMKPKDVKKISQQAISKYREEYSSVQRRKRAIEITDREWEAIQNGAISENKLKRILDNADVDSLRKRATPKASTTLSSAKVNRIKAMKNSNYSSSEIAEALGISTATVSKYLKEVN
jgi:predicted transcriptional regulator